MYRSKNAGENPEEIKEIVTAELKRIGDEVKSAGEKALKEAKNAGDLSAETKGKVDELLVKQGELQARLQEAEQKLDRRGSSGEMEHKTAGAEFVNSEKFKEYVEAGNFRKGFTGSVKTITSAAESAGVNIEPDRLAGILAPAVRRLTVRDLISPGSTNSNLIQYVRESGFTNAAATVAEGAKKPESSIEFDLVSTPVVKIAHYVKASTEILMDAPMLQSYIDQRLRYGLDLVEEGQLLNGSGVGNNLSGIMTQAASFAAPLTIADATSIDTIRLALLQSELAEFPSTGIVLHPSNWAGIELTKDGNGAYIFANPQSLAQPALWGRPVVTTQAMDAGNFLVGAFRLGAQVFDRMQTTVTVANENEDDFIHNLVTILLEKRLGLAVYRPEAFVKGALA